MDDVADLTRQLSELDIDTNRESLWELGGIDQTGKNISSTTRLRIISYLPGNVYLVVPKPDRKVIVIAYKDGQYHGIWNGAAFTNTAVWLTQSVDLRVIGDYDYRLLIAKSDNSTLTISDYDIVTLLSKTDDTFTKPNVPADSFAVGGLVKTVNDMHDFDCVYQKAVNLDGIDGGFIGATGIQIAGMYKKGNVVRVHRSFASESHMYNLIGTKLYDFYNIAPTGSNYPDAFADDIPEFIVGHLYKIELTVIDGSFTLDDPSAQFAYLDFRIKTSNSTISGALPNGSVFYCNIKPQSIMLRLRKGVYDCNISINIVDVTNQYATHVNESKNLLQIFDKITSIGDSLMCGYTAATNPVTNSEIAKERGANWVSYVGLDIGRTITNLAVGGTSWKDWRNSTANADISTANIDTNCYLVGLGVNDSKQGLTIGTSADIATDKADNADSVYGNMDFVIRTLHGYNPNAHVLLFTIPSEETNKDQINEAIKYMATLYTYVGCIDLDSLYSADVRFGIISKTLVSGHYNPLGYRVIANYIASAINSYMITNYTTFAKVPYQL